MLGMTAAEKNRLKFGKETFSDDDVDETIGNDEESKLHDHVETSLSKIQRLSTNVEIWTKYFIPLLLFIFLLLLLVWDMKTTSSLSEIIHDDHADLWQPMNSSDLSSWLSPLDLCLLKIDEENVDIKLYRQQNCKTLEGVNAADTLRLFCGIGSSLGKQCTSPLSTRSFFTSRLIGTLGDPHNNLLKSSLRQLAKEKKALIFIGDAISKQNQEATVCELLRTDRITVTGGLRIGANSTVSEFGIRWRDQPALTMDIIFLHVAHISGGHNSHGSRYLQGHETEIKVNSSNYASSVQSMTLTSVGEQLNRLLVRFPGGIVVVANIGVWYNSREKYRKELSVFLKWLNSIGKSRKNKVLFRETAAQHWNHTVNGYYTLEEEDVLADSSCVPIQDSREDLDWRNRDVRFTIENEHLKHIHIVPFRDITAPLYDMHPDGYGSKDCTRFCYFPQMWQSVWWKINDVAKNNYKRRYRRKR